MNVKILAEATVRRVLIVCTQRARARIYGSSREGFFVNHSPFDVVGVRTGLAGPTCSRHYDIVATPANLGVRYNLTGRRKGAWLGGRVNDASRKAHCLNTPSLFLPACW